MVYKKKRPAPVDWELSRVIGVNVRKLRQNHGWAQDAVAKTLPVSVPFMSNLERGHRRFRPEDLPKLAELFGVSMEDLTKP